MIDLDSLKEAGVTVKRFCGLDIQDGVGCTGEAVGELVAVLEDGIEVPIPVCQPHRDVIMAEFEVEQT